MNAKITLRSPAWFAAVCATLFAASVILAAVTSQRFLARHTGLAHAPLLTLPEPRR